jgi:hypothetical protein
LCLVLIWICGLLQGDDACFSKSTEVWTCEDSPLAGQAVPKMLWSWHTEVKELGNIMRGWASARGACSPCLLMNKRFPPHCCIIPPQLVLFSTMHLSDSCSSRGTLQCDSALLLASMYELPPHLTIGNSVFAGMQGLFLHQRDCPHHQVEGDTTARTPFDTFSDP